MFKKILAVAVLLLATSCGGGDPSDMAPFEPGLVGQYALIEIHGDNFDIIHEEGQARLGDMLLQDDDTFEQNFTRDAAERIGYYGRSGLWNATLATIEFNGLTMGYDTSKVGDIGADIGDLLTIDDPHTDIVFVWVKITTAPRN